MTERRCAVKGTPLRLLLALSVLCCCLTTAIEAHAQFTNLRVFRAGDLFNKDYWRPPAKSFKNSDDIDPVHSSSRKSEIGGSSPIKRVSMATLLQQLNHSSSTKKEVIPIIAHEEHHLSIPVAIETSPAVASPVSKESQIRRIKLPAGSIYFSRNFNNSLTGPIQVSINPHLSSSTTTTTTTTTEAPSSTTTEEPTTTTTEATTTATEPSTTTTDASTTSETPTAKSHKAKPQPAKVYPNGKAKTSSSRASNFGSSKKLSEMENSPIYYIKLPASAFVSAARTPHRDDSVPFFKQSPIFVATTRRPGINDETTTTTTTETPSDSLSTTTRRPTRTNSRIINIKGPFVFNGKPGGIYSAPAPYRPPNYLDILHSIYPKLKRAQFIRR